MQSSQKYNNTDCASKVGNALLIFLVVIIGSNTICVRVPIWDFGSRGLGFKIRLIEEVSKQDQIAGVHGKGYEDVTVGSAALTPGTQIVQTSEIGHNADDHLENLRESDEHAHLLWDPETHGFQGVVCVHEGVDDEVHHYEPASSGDQLTVAVGAVAEHGQVVVPMQEDQGLLAQNDEHSVSQLDELGIHHDEGPEGAGILQEVIGITYRVFKIIPEVGLDEFWAAA